MAVNLIDEIQGDALKSDVALADTLRKVVALGGQVGSPELREWASRELHGYVGSGVEVPGYRKTGALIQLDAVVGNNIVQHQQISPSDFPEVVREYIDEEVVLGRGIGEIEAMLESAKESGALQLTLPNASMIARLMNQQVGDPYQKITAIYWLVVPSALQGVIDRIRTTLVELMAEMRAGTPSSAELPPPEVANQAVNVAVHGDKARVSINAPHVSGDGSHHVHTGSWRENRSSLWVVVGSLATVAAVVIAVFTWQGWWT